MVSNQPPPQVAITAFRILFVVNTRCSLKYRPNRAMYGRGSLIFQAIKLFLVNNIVSEEVI